MDHDDQVQEEGGLGPLSSLHSDEGESDEQPDPSTSQDEPQQRSSYWLAQYFTKARYDLGLSVMAVKYPSHWPREKVEKAARDVQKGDKFAVKDLPLTVKQVTTLSEPVPSENSSDWRVTYRVFKSPNTKAAQRVQLNYSNVFTEDEVTTEAHRALANHPQAEPNSLIIERVSDSQSRKDSLLDALFREEEIYPVEEDKDWLKKMTTSENPTTERTAATATRKRALSSESSVRSGKRRSLRLYDKEKEKDTKAEKEEDLQPDVQPDPMPTTSKKSSKPLLTPKERFKGKVFQHPCPDCGKAYRTNQLLKTHRSECVQCPTCGKWRDQRHADKCKNNKLCPVCDHWFPEDHKCRGRKLLKGKQILCAYCQRAITEGHMYNHMKSIHGMAWSKGAYPECIPVDQFEEQQRLKFQMEQEKKELEVLRAERENAAALKEAHDEAIKKVEADRLRLEEENLSLKHEKLQLEGQKLEADKAIFERDEQLKQVTDLIRAKEAEILQKEEELNSIVDRGYANRVEVVEKEDINVEPDPQDLVGSLTQEEREAMRDDTYWFPVPSAFCDAKKNRPSEEEVEKMLSIVPGFVSDAVLLAMPDSVLSGMPNLVFLYNQRGRLPNWTVIWFIRALRRVNNRSADETLFMRAMHIIEALREKLFKGRK